MIVVSDLDSVDEWACVLPGVYYLKNFTAVIKYCMMKTLVALVLAVLLTGCAGFKTLVPSFWDDNQSARIIDVRFQVERLDCSSPAVNSQVAALRDSLLWFELYSESKGSRQQDVIRIVHPIRETVEDMHKRYGAGEASQGYCQIKQRILRSQSQRAAEAVLGRY